MASHVVRKLREEKPIIGVVHLLPLPGSPRYGGSLGVIVRRAMDDAEAYVEGGLRWIIVENYGDAPYNVRVREPETIASLTAIARELVESFSGVTWGINMLRNSAPEALAVAYAVGAEFIRVNALVETVVAPEGILYPVARERAEAKALLGAWNIGVLADIHVKHGAPLAPRGIEETARDAVGRG
ncbi:MAG: BtpA/SgcQ family protein, partial [Candidatus Korarchaeota archaeon]|nr:BtpA/SgcQ family protein [Candidatus Korarchaeota archaeon]